MFTVTQFSLVGFEQIRPIDKKFQYQIQKLTKAAAGGTDNVGVGEKEADVSQKTEDLLKYRPNPDMLVSKTDETSQVNCISTRVLNCDMVS